MSWSVRFYEHQDFGGEMAEIPAMTPGELHKTGHILNERVRGQVSSFQVNTGYRVWVYSGIHQDGVGSAYDSDQNRLDHSTPPGNDAIQSFKVERT